MITVALSMLAGASLQGLYVTWPETAQLTLLSNWNQDNVTAATETPVGVPLSDKGFSAPMCSPSTIQTTGKWYYTLAKNTSAGGFNTTPWNLISVFLDGSTIRAVQVTLQHTFFSLSVCS
jgi:hypothetical protein